MRWITSATALETATTTTFTTKRNFAGVSTCPERRSSRDGRQVTEGWPLPAFSQGHDAKGNLTADGDGLLHTFDFDNMLRQVVVASASPRGLPGVHTYAYDALGRRVSKSVDTDADNIPDETTVFVCAGQQVIAEYEAGTVSTDPERKYIFNVTGYIDEPIALIDATGVSEDTYYCHRNRQYSISGLTSSTGAVVERYSYTAYGDVTIYNGAGTAIRTTSLYGNPYTYTGRRLDTETGLHYFRARYHDPVLGRFLERDPLGYPDGMNTYAAYHVMRGGLDPYGLFFRWVRDKVLGIDSKMVERNQKQIAKKAREAGREDIARQAEQTAKDFEENVVKEAWKGATGCKRKCGESVWDCVNRIGESADIQDQLFNEAVNLAGELAFGEDYASPAEGAGTLISNQAQATTREVAHQLYADVAGNQIANAHRAQIQKHIADIAVGPGGGKNSAVQMINDVARNAADDVASQNSKLAKNAAKSFGKGLAKGAAATAAWEIGLRAGALVHCDCEPTGEY